MNWSDFENECIHFVDYVTGLGKLHEAVFHIPQPEHPIAKEHSADTLIAEMISEGMTNGVCRQVNATLAAPLLFSALHTTAEHILRHGGRNSRLNALRDMLRSWLSVEFQVKEK